MSIKVITPWDEWCAERKLPQQSLAGTSTSGVFVSPWKDATQDGEGNWVLPEYPCEIPGLANDDPRNQKWRPGEYIEGVDNVTESKETNQLMEWGGQKMWEGDVPPADWNPGKFSEDVQRVLKVPHMPGQPLKETYARLKALDPRPFEDKWFEEIHRDLPDNIGFIRKCIQWAEGFGIHSEQNPGEWQGMEDELVPSVYVTPRSDAVTICVGIAGQTEQDFWVAGVEYDYVDWLYAKDQEGKIIQIQSVMSMGMSKCSFTSYTFVPPKGTTSITPLASFKIRGVWEGTPITWDPSVDNDTMQWFTDMSPEMRLELAEREKLTGVAKKQVEAIRFPKNRKREPVLWPENSWEGNAIKARLWDEQHQD